MIYKDSLKVKRMCIFWDKNPTLKIEQLTILYGSFPRISWIGVVIFLNVQLNLVWIWNKPNHINENKIVSA